MQLVTMLGHENVVVVIIKYDKKIIVAFTNGGKQVVDV
jgi:hypothetical protein